MTLKEANKIMEECKELDDLMEKVSYNNSYIKIIDKNDVEYIGIAYGYTQRWDEEDRISSIAIDTKDKGGWGLMINEIKSLEILD